MTDHPKDDADQRSRSSPDWQERFPALRLLTLAGGSKQVPHVPTFTLLDCGPACLASILRYFGKDVRLQEVIQQCGGSHQGTSALTLLEAAKRFGLRGRAIKIDIEALSQLPPATILFWQFNHYVVLERQVRQGILIVDPNAGRRKVGFAELSNLFTGVAIVFEKGESFTPGGKQGTSLAIHLRRIISHRALLFRVIATSAMLQLFGLGLPILTAAVVDRVVPYRDLALLGFIGVACAGAAVCYALTNLVRSQLLLHLRTHLDVQMTLEFLDHLVNLPLRFFQQRSSGDLMMRLNSNTTVRETLTSSALSSALDAAMALSYLAALLFMSAPLALVVLLIASARGLLFAMTGARLRELAGTTLGKQAASQGYQVQMFAGLETLKAAGAEGRAVDRWAHLFVEYLNAVIERGRFAAIFQALADGLTYAGPLAILACGAYLSTSGTLSLGAMLALNALGLGVLQPVTNLIATATQLKELGSYTDRLDDVLCSEPEQPPGVPRAKIVLQGDIVLEDVCFRYGPQMPFALDKVSLTIRKGQRVAIVGPSGSGKSTLARLLVGLHSPDSGRVLYDGNDLRTLDLQGVRSQIGSVLQDVYLFNTSIRDNIALACPDRPLDDVVSAARLAQIHDRIMALPMQYESLVTDSGRSLSGGERQRVALARALVNKPPILVLDEATSAIDAVNERRVQLALAGLRCTQVIIAHRLSTIRDADIIVVLGNGTVVETGVHDELVERGGAYAELLSGQFQRSLVQVV